MFNQFAHAGQEHTEDTASETQTDNEQIYQTTVADDKSYAAPESEFSFVPFASGGVLVVILTFAIIGAFFMYGKKKA
jgi:hypothetical protein